MYHQEYETFSPSSRMLPLQLPLQNGQNRIDILLDNLRPSTIDPPSLTFEDIVVSWFKELLLGDSKANDETGVNNRIFQAYGLTF
jgi:hypothetical protein